MHDNLSEDDISVKFITTAIVNGRMGRGYADAQAGVIHQGPHHRAPRVPRPRRRAGGSRATLRRVDSAWDAKLTEALRADTGAKRVISPFIKPRALDHPRPAFDMHDTHAAATPS